jgi:xanthine dehydrogenase YagS FAD-binding subunit
MSAVEYVRPDDVAGAVAMVSTDPGGAYLAGGTTHLDLLLKDGVVETARLVDLGRLPLRGINRCDGALRVGALTTMEELAADPTVTEPGGGRLAARGGGGATHRPPARAAGTARLGGPA